MSEVSSDTLLGILQQNDQNLADYVVDDILEGAPFLEAAHAQVATMKTRHEFDVETTAPGVGFRSVNTGLKNAAGKNKTEIIDLVVLDATVRRDKAIAKGSIYGVEGYMNRQGVRSLRAAFAAIDKQILKGTANAEGGFKGLGDFIDAYNPSMQKIIQAGTTGSCVYMGRFGEDAVSVLAGDEGRIEVGDIVDIDLLDSSSNPYPGLEIPILGWIGLQVAGRANLARLANVSQTEGTYSLTDDMLLDLFDLFPSAVKPDFIVLGRRDLVNLAKSRTATSPTGAPAPLPTVWEGAGYPIRLIVDDFADTDVTVTTTTTSTTTTTAAAAE